VRPTLGLIVNPAAGLGGPLGLKGSDGEATLREALARGAEPAAPARAGEALAIVAAAGPVRVLAAAGDMGEAVARALGLEPEIVAGGAFGATTPEETRRAAAAIERAGCDLLLFAGGDGTARDIAASVGTRVPAIGIPAGVKMHSAVYAVTPRAAGTIAARHLARPLPLRELEVMDIDEAGYRAGVLSVQLYGFLSCPYDRLLTQGVKEGRVNGDLAAADAIAAEVVERLVPGRFYLLGPGTTTRAIARRLGIEKTLLGVDVIRDGTLVTADAAGPQLSALLDGKAFGVIVTPIGGQGHILGRGNQQIGADLLRRVGKAGLIVVATPGKLASLQARPLRVDTGDPALDRMLAGPIRVVTGYRTVAICPVEA
jgi:predicted polyphosphate/ATP-dependent NAD kinase